MLGCTKSDYPTVMGEDMNTNYECQLHYRKKKFCSVEGSRSGFPFLTESNNIQTHIHTHHTHTQLGLQAQFVHLTIFNSFYFKICLSGFVQLSAGTHKGWKKESESFGLELQATVNHWTRVLGPHRNGALSELLSYRSSPIHLDTS